MIVNIAMKSLMALVEVVSYRSQAAATQEPFVSAVLSSVELDDSQMASTSSVFSLAHEWSLQRVLRLMHVRDGLQTQRKEDKRKAEGVRSSHRLAVPKVLGAG